MQETLRKIVDEYLAEVERHLGALCDSKKTEAILELRDHITSSFSHSGPMVDPEARIREILNDLGEPAALAESFIPQPKPEEIISHDRRRVILAAALVIALIGLGIAIWLRFFPPRAPGELTPEMRAAAATRLTNLFAKYCGLNSFTAQLHFETRAFSKTCWQGYIVSHSGNRTYLRPSHGDLPELLISDTQTTIHLPWLNQYTLVSYGDLERVFFGKSIIVALLQDEINPSQYTIDPEEITGVTSTDTSTTITFVGVYLNWGDARFTTIIDNENEEILELSVVKNYSDTELLQGKSRTFFERLTDARCNPELPVEQVRLELPTDATFRGNLEWYLLTLQEGAKGAFLIGQPAPPFAGLDVITNQQVTLESYRGKHLILTTCGSWVPWARTYLAALNTLYQRYRPYGLEIVNLAPDVEPAQTMHFLKLAGIQFPYLTDYSGWESPNLVRYDAYRKRDYTPEFVLIDAEGRVVDVVATYVSPVTDSLAPFVQMVEQLLGAEITGRVEEEYRRELVAMSADQALARAEQSFAGADDFHGKYVLEQLAERDPQCLEAKLALCRYYLDYNHTLAKTLAESCLIQTDTSPYPYLLMGDYYRLETREMDRAYREYQRAVKLAPEDWRVNNRLGDYYCALNEKEKAIRYYRQALARFSANNVLCDKVGKEYALLGDYANAASFYERAFNEQVFLRGGADEFSIYACRMIGWAQDKLACRDQAIRWLERAFAYDGHRDDVLYELGSSLTFDGDNPTRAVTLTRRLTAENANGNYFHLYGCALNRAERYREAVAAFREALQLDPAIETTYANIGFAYEGIGDTVAAQASYRRAIEQFPDCWLTRQARERLQTLDRGTAP